MLFSPQDHSISCGKPCGCMGNVNFHLRIATFDAGSYVVAWEM